MKYRNILIGVIVIILILFLRIGCKNAEIASVETTNSLLQIENQKFEKIINNQDDSIVKQRAIIIKDKEQLKTFTDSIFKLKEKVKSVTAFYKEVIKTNWDTVNIPYTDTQYIPNPFLQTGDTITKELYTYINNSVKVPNPFNIDSSLYSIKGEVTKQGVRIDSLNIPDTFNLRIVETKGKLFKPSFIEFQSLHTNKLVQVTGVNSIMYKLPKKTFWQVVLDKLVWVGIGLGLSKTLL
jgi:hypothetical protein